MTIIHKGIRRKTTDVLDDYGQAHYLQNVRLKRVGEMGRRAGLGKSTMAQLAGPVQFMVGAWSNEPFIVNGTGGDVTGNADPLAYWTGATIGGGGGGAGQPAAPVINSVTFTPPSGTASYIVGNVIFDIDVTYDGLSGPLEYGYIWTAGPATPQGPTTTASNVSTFDFDLNCLDGNYNFDLYVYPAANPALFGLFIGSYTVNP